MFLTTSHCPDWPRPSQPSQPVGKITKQNLRAAGRGPKAPLRARGEHPSLPSQWDGMGESSRPQAAPFPPKMKACTHPRTSHSHMGARGAQAKSWAMSTGCPRRSRAVLCHSGAGVCAHPSRVLHPFLRCPQALGCCSSLHLSVLVLPAECGHPPPPTPFLLPTMPWKPENVCVLPPLFVCGCGGFCLFVFK